MTNNPQETCSKRSTRCLYDQPIGDFLSQDPNSILGRLNERYHGDLNTNSREAWDEEIKVMKQCLESPELRNRDGEIIFEYNIPRMGKRIDVVLIIKGIIFCLEFKVGQANVNSQDIDQVLDYALDLKNFHELSHERLIVPILIPTNHLKSSSLLQSSEYHERILNPLIASPAGLAHIIDQVLQKYPDEPFLKQGDWIKSPYRPSPSIIEAATALYENHSVDEITSHAADDDATEATISYILDVIRHSKENNRKSICFVTGVPGAGKTLVGLEVAVKQTYQGKSSPIEGEGAVYLSGNGPLVAVLTEALARNNYQRNKEKAEEKKEKCKKRLSDSRREVKKFIQGIHNYRDDMLAKIENPVRDGILKIDHDKVIANEKNSYAEPEHVAIFDEAQRSWTHARIANYLKRGGTYGNKLKVSNFPMSEAAFLIWSLDQHHDWATIVCLVGGGQEINTGEAGISEWINAVNNNFPHWNVYISDKLTETEYADGKVNEMLSGNKNATTSDKLHLSVSKRSFRAEKLSAFVHHLLALDADKAREIYSEIKDRYPIVLTRDMDLSRKWLREKGIGREQTGVLITKTSARFKPMAIHVLPQGDENAVHWFLEDRNDTRSSNFLEDAATEIQVQGLELDYTCILWDADMRYDNGRWRYFNFNGKSKWNELHADTESRTESIKYMLNAYRVLLTRARKGMVICVPEGNANRMPNSSEHEDPTRLPQFYDPTFNYLRSIGIPLYTGE